MTVRLSLKEPQGISDALSLAMSDGCLLLSEEECGSAFFDLRTGIAGELLQKFTNYHLPLAIVVSNVEGHGSRFKELAYEHSQHELIRFFQDNTEAKKWLDVKTRSEA